MSVPPQLSPGGFFNLMATHSFTTLSVFACPPRFSSPGLVLKYRVPFTVLLPLVALSPPPTASSLCVPFWFAFVRGRPSPPGVALSLFFVRVLVPFPFPLASWFFCQCQRTSRTWVYAFPFPGPCTTPKPSPPPRPPCASVTLLGSFFSLSVNASLHN